MNKKVIHSVFEQVVSASPANIAVEAGGRSITYQGLNEYANRLAHLLKLAGGVNGSIVNVMVPPSIECVGALLAVFKAGGIYLPFDLSFSEKRLKQIFTTTYNGLVVVAARELEKFLEAMGRLDVVMNKIIVIEEDDRFSLLDKDFTETAAWLDGPVLEVTGDSGNYIFYTSGSTGEGKPILGAHASLSHFIHWEISEFGLNAGFRYSQLAQTTFDAFLRDVFVALISGGTLCVPSADTKSNPAQLLEWLKSSRINMVHCVPSLFRVMTKELLSSRSTKFQLPDLRYIVMGGEILFAKDILSWRKAVDSPAQLVNIYGATETTLIKTFYRITQVSENPSHVIPVGVPISNTTVAIIKSGRICKVGEPGEIYIKTPFASKGYYNNEALTSTCFVQNPLVKDRADIVYKTGDIGRYLADGNIEVVGRLDNQVKVNGVRVELGEVEGAMLSHEKITGSVVTVYKSNDNLTSLVGYYTGEKLDNEALRNALMKILNPQVIPSFFIHLNEFPLNINGKVDKKALPLPVDVIMGSDAEPPVGEVEMELAEIWKELLGLEKIGRNVSFFSIGGHSLRAIQLTARIEKKLGVNVKVADIFIHHTIRDLADFLSAGLKAQHQQILCAPVLQDYPLSSSQRRIWILSQFRESNIAYNISGVYVFEGSLDHAAFERALQALVARHESLRTVFGENESGAVRQVILRAGDSGFTPDVRDVITEDVKELVAQVCSAPFDLSAGSLIRAGLWRLEEGKWMFAYTMHHIISDYWSMFVLIRELLQLYNAEAALQPLHIQYKDYAWWQQQQLTEGVLNDDKEYWLSKLQGEMPVLELPTDRARPAMKTYNGSVIRRKISSGAVQGLRKLTQERSATMFMGLLAAVNALLHRYTGQGDIIIGSPVAGRVHIDLEDQIGLYLNTLPLRARFSGQDSYSELLDKIMQVTLEAYDHQQYPLDELLDALNLQRDMSRNFLFDVLIDYHDTTGLGALPKLRDVEVQMHEELAHVVSKFDLTFMFMESGAGLLLSLEYNTDLFLRETIEQMCAHFERLLESAVALPSQAVGQLGMLSESERVQLVAEFNDVPVEFSGYESVVSMIRDSDCVAVEYLDSTLSYQELNEKSDRLAGYLVKSHGKRVGILLDRSLNTVVSILGVLKAGAAYVPIDTEYPAARKQYIIENAELDVLLTQTEYMFSLDFYQGAVIAVDIQLDAMEPLDVELPEPLEDSLAYIIYTSGSTGNPKGCMITHGNLSNYIRWANSYYFDEAEPACFGLFTSLSFDLTVTSIFCTLTQGGTLTVFDQQADLGEIFRQSFDSGINSIKLTPSHISYLKELNLSSSTIQTAIVGGEQITSRHVSALKQINTNIKIYNEYGPTETTVGCIVALLEEDIIIGKPIANTFIYILNDNELCAVGVPGEICISGAGVGKGYLNNNQNFVPDPFRPGFRMYRTGDIGKWLNDGNIVYIGRKDEQVKIRGYRIELGEIESILQAHESVEAAVVIARNDELIAYIVQNEDVELRQWLAEHLPAYMMPAHFVKLDALPLTAHGKIDRRQLPDLNEEVVSYVAPRNEPERQLAAVYSEVLKKETVGVNDDFFVLGGDSIKAIQVVSRLRQRGYVVTVQDVLLHPVLDDLATLVKQPGGRVIEQGIVEGEIALTPIQKLFFSNASAVKHHYNQSILLESNEPLSETALRAALDKIWEHHDALRMVFDGEKQYNRGIAESYGWETSFEGIQESFNLSEGPLFKAAMSGNKLLLIAHHLVMDGVSWRIILEDLATLYGQYLSGKQLLLPPKTDSYAYWQKQLEAYVADESYWAALPEVPALPTDMQGSNLVKDASSNWFMLDEEVTKQLLTQCYKAYRTDTNDVLITALSLAINNIFGVEQLALSMESHGREDIGADVTRTVGWFTSVYPVVINIKSDRIRQLIETKEQLHRVPNKGVGYAVLKYLKNTSINFNYLGDFGGNADETQPWKLSGEPHGNAITGEWHREALIGVTGITVEGRLRISITYSNKQYTVETIEKLSAAFKYELENLISDLSSTTTTHLTPVDLTYKQLTVEQLDNFTDIEDIYTLSPLQEGLYYTWLMSPQSTVYFEQMSYRIKAGLNADLLEQSYKYLVARHRALRTSFSLGWGEKALQIVKKEVPCNFHYQQIENNEASIAAFRLADRAKGFDLHNGSQMRLQVLELGNKNYEFIWSHHHVLMDGWCTSILIKEFFQIYQSLAKGLTPELGKVQPYSAYIEWLSKQDPQASLQYWRNYLQGYESISSLPKKQEIQPGFTAQTTGFSISGELRRKIRSVCAELGITESTFIQVAWALLVAKYNNAEEVVFGAVVSGRPPELKGIEDMIGMFINTVPVRVKAGRDAAITDILKAVQQSSVESVPHHYTQLGRIQAETIQGKDLFDHIILFENYPMQELVEQGMQSAPVSLVSFETFAQNNFDFTVTVLPAQNITIRFDYNSNVYENAQAERMKEHFISMLQEVAVNVSAQVKDISYLSEAERKQLIEQFNDVPATFSGYESVVSLINDSNSIALKYFESTLSYKELNEKSGRLAGYLVKNHGKRVGILLDRSLNTIVSILGVLKAGAAYVPIDTEYPAARKQYIIENAGIDVLLTQTEYMFSLDFYQGAVIAVDIQLDAMEPLDIELPEPLEDTLAYIIYTSGSTGNPKGCMITHGNLSNYIRWANSYYFNEPACFGLFTSLSFDLTVTSIFCTLTQGGTLTVFDQHADLSEIFRESFDSGINSIKLTPSHISYLKELNLSSSSIQTAIVGGEQITSKHISTLQQINPNIKIYNEYGPTETTVGCIVTLLEEEIIIGKPIANTFIYILNDNELCPIGVPGEICISGAGVGKGYLNNNQNFVPDPFRPGLRMYRTGDTGKWLSDGNIVYIGRKDEQVKIRGYRIELGEIESILLAHESVDAATVVARNDELIAYIVQNESIDLRQWVSQHLPSYMIPAHFVKLGSLPLTIHGKIDKRQLPEPAGASESSYIAPRNEMEKQLVSIWQQVLEKDKIGIADNFFDAGGNSLRIVRLSNLVSQLLGKEISVAQLFEYPSIKSLLDHITNEPVVYEQEEFDRGELIGDLNKFNIDEDGYR